jgi:dGTPase
MVKKISKEDLILASYAIKSADSNFRKFSEATEDKRPCFQKDKGRIIHCKAFRRLDQKTQVFTAGIDDHYRTRLTHTIEVEQIGRDIARRLNLNEDLCEAIALAHDLGHPPFGHAGEGALNEVMQEFGRSFEHNQQSQRVVEVLEKAYPNFDGLNLTLEVLDGMIKHQTAWDQDGKQFEVSAHLEAQVVNLADEIAYTNHDIDDGLRSGIITLSALRKLQLWSEAEEEVIKKYGKISDRQVLISRVISSIMSAMIEDLCATTEQNITENKIVSVADVRKVKKPIVRFSEEMVKDLKAMREFLYQNFYLSPKIIELTREGTQMIKKLFYHYMESPDQFPKKDFLKNDKDITIAVKDYIAGMTDRFLVDEYEKIFNKK